MHAMLPLVFLFAAVNTALALVFISMWARNFQQTRRYMRAGLAAVLVVMAVDVTVWLSLDVDEIGKLPVVLFFMECWVAVRIYAFVVVGAVLADRLNAATVAPGALVSERIEQTRYGLSVPTSKALLYALLAIAFFVVFTVTLFQWSGARIDEALLTREEDPFRISFVAILTIAAMGFAEEITFRLGLQNGLTYWWRSSRFAHYWAVLVTSAFWSLGHIGTVEPGWVKITQVMLIGLVLGQMNRKFGVIPCIITHSTFNVVIALLSPTVFGHMVEPL